MSGYSPTRVCKAEQVVRAAAIAMSKMFAWPAHPWKKKPMSGAAKLPAKPMVPIYHPYEMGS